MAYYGILVRQSEACYHLFHYIWQRKNDPKFNEPNVSFS